MKKIIRFLVFILIFVFIFQQSYRILSWKDTSGDYVSSTEQLYATEDNTVDVVFLGSSHCYCTIMPYMLWNEYGMSAFDMSISGQDRESTYFHIKEVLKTQSPKVVCVDLGAMVYDGYLNEGNLYRNMLSMNLSENNVELIKAIVKEEEQLDFVTRWPILHTRYAELEKYDFKQNQYSEFGRGNGFPIGMNNPFMDIASLESKEVGEIPEEKKEWLDRVIKLSKEEGFELIFYTAPFRMDINQKAMYNAVSKYLEEQDIVYFDYNNYDTLPELDFEKDFLDFQHVNMSGARKITNQMGEYIAVNYNLEDHRGDEKYDFWELDSEYSSHYLLEETIKSEENWSVYVNRLLNTNGLTVVISLDGNYLEATAELQDMLVLLELDEGYQAGGKWIIQDGSLIKRIAGDDYEPYYLDLGEDMLKVSNIEGIENSLVVGESIVMNGDVMGQTNNGLTIFVYDTILNKVIDTRYYY